MPVYDTSKLADARTVAENLAGLPKEALLYIAGYAEGYRDNRLCGGMYAAGRQPLYDQTL